MITAFWICYAVLAFFAWRTTMIGGQIGRF